MTLNLEPIKARQYRIAHPGDTVFKDHHEGSEVIFVVRPTLFAIISPPEEK